MMASVISASVSPEQDRFSSYIKGKIKSYFGVDLFVKYLSNQEYFANDGELVIQCTNKDSYSVLTGQYYHSISKLLSILWPETKVSLKISLKEEKKPQIFAGYKQDIFSSEVESGGNVIFQNFNDSTYSFENFIQDESNELALFLTKTFSEKQTEFLPDGNILFIYGDVGHGKTHLARATNASMKKNGISSAYFAAESFTSGFVSALRSNNLFSFKNEIMSKDALIFDDIHCMMGRTHSFNELCNIICSMLDNGKRVVLTSVQRQADFPIKIKSRIMSGVSAQISKCTTELKRKIANSMILTKNISISSSVVDFLIINIKGGVRELKGAINRLSAGFAVNNKKISIDLAKITLADLLIEGSASKSSYKDPIEKIKLATSIYFEIPEEKLCSKTKSQDIVLPRNVAMYLCRSLLKMTYSSIANHFNRSTHNSTMMAILSLENKVKLNDTNSIKVLNSVKRIMGQM